MYRRESTAPVGTCLFESLESRTLFAAAPFVAGGTLNVMGDCRSANSIVVDNSADGTSVDVSVAFTNARGAAKSVVRSFPKSLGFSAVRIVGGNSDDTVFVGRGAGDGGASFALDVRVNARNGNDVVYTGAGRDVVVGGKGGDEIDVGPGDDRVHAGPDDDGVTGGDGNDILWGGLGDDVINAGDGDDLLGGVLGANFMTGGAGRDTFVVRDLAVQFDHDFDATEDVLQVVRTKDDGNAAPVV